MMAEVSLESELHSKECQRKSHEVNGNTIENTLLGKQLREGRVAVDAFIENRFQEALDICDEKADHSLYHSVGRAYMQHINATLTLDKDDVEIGLQALNHSLDMSSKMRRQKGIFEAMGDWFRTPHYDEYTDEECHAELVHADMLSMSALLSFVHDSSFFTMVKSAFKARSAQKSYAECMKILSERTKWENDAAFNEFRSGTMSGNGLNQLGLSHLPPGVLKIVEMVGYSGDRIKALQWMKDAVADRTTLRFPLITVILSSYHLYIEHMGLAEGDLDYVEQLLTDLQLQFPNSAFMLIQVAKLKQLRGDIKGAIEEFSKMFQLQKQWKQMHVFCYWELSQSYAITGDWVLAAKYTQLMWQHSVYGKSIYCHQYACFLYMQMIEENKTQLKEEIREHMKLVPTLRKRYAGKTIPPEKFAVTKAADYLENEEKAVLPAYEIFYFYNIFRLTNGRPETIKPMLHRTDHELDKIDKESSIDEYVFLMLVRGVMYRYLESYDEAVNCFEEIFANETKIKRDTYIPPQAAVEMGLTLMKMDKLTDAKAWLDKARTKYNKFLCEMYLQIRIHGALQQIKVREKRRDMTLIGASGS